MIAKQVFAGLDLGAVSDFTALVVFDVERIPDPDRTGISRGQPPRTVNEFGITWIKRWPLLTPYPEMVAELQRMYSITPRLQNGTLIVDGTGVGRPVVEMIVQARLPTTVRPYSITAGRNPNENPEPGCFPTVPKLDLVGSVSAVLQQRRIKLADPAAVKLGPLLMKELGTFKVKTDDVTRNETFGCFVTGTLIETRRGQIPIESVKQDDLVLTRVGYRRVLWSGVTKYTRSLAEVRLSNGSVLRGTPDHLVWTGNRGWVELAGLREGDQCFPSNLQSTASEKVNSPRSLSSTDESTAVVRAHQATTSSLRAVRGGIFTETCGNSIAESRSHMATTFTTLTRTRTTTIRPTWNALQTRSTRSGIINLHPLLRERVLSVAQHSSSGMQDARTFTIPDRNSALVCVPTGGKTCLKNSSASTVERNTKQLGTVARANSSADRCVEKPIGMLTDNSLSSLVQDAERSSGQSTRSPRTVHVVAPARRLLLDSAAPVFDLSVDGQPEFFANGVLCHNSFRDGENDDCVLAAALAIWYAEYHAYRQPGLAGIGLPPPGQTLLPPSMGKMKPGNFPFGKPGEKGGPYG